MVRYGRGKTWVCNYIAQPGFPGEIGHRFWRLDHVLSFERRQGVSAVPAPPEATTAALATFIELATSPANTFVGIKELMVRYVRGKTLVCAFVNQTGFPGEIGYRVWRLDHVMAFEDARGTALGPVLATNPQPITVSAQIDVDHCDDDILTRRRDRKKAA